MNEIIKKEDSLDLINQLNTSEKAIFEAAEPKDMLKSVIVLAETKDALTQAKKILKDSIKDPTAFIKNIETKFKQVESDLKAKVIETYKSEIVVKQKQDEETGEVTFKEYENNNLGKNIFTFSKASEVTAESIDYKAMLADPEKYKDHLVEVVTYKIAPSIIGLSLEDARELGLPTAKSTTSKDASVGIQWTQMKKKVAEKQAKLAAEKEAKDE